MLNKCYCNSDKSFEECCKPFLQKEKNAPTAEKLMRSRYTAYCVQAVDYLIETTHSSTRKWHNPEDVLEWSKSNIWAGLEILNTSENVVEFKAYYLDSNKSALTHHEKSNFLQENGIWFYVDSTFY